MAKGKSISGAAVGGTGTGTGTAVQLSVPSASTAYQSTTRLRRESVEHGKKNYMKEC